MKGGRPWGSWGEDYSARFSEILNLAEATPRSTEPAVSEFLGELKHIVEKRKQLYGYWLPKYQEQITTDARDIPEVKAMLEDLTEKAKHTVHADWYIKHAGLYFTYEDKAYLIGPKTLDTSSEVFDALVSEMVDRLYAIGAYDMFSSCELD